MAVRSRLASASHAGFTLVELLVAMALMVVVTTMLATVLINAQSMYDRTVARATITANARTALDMIGKDLSHIIPTPARLRTDDQRPLALVLRSKDIPPRNLWNTPAEQSYYVDSSDFPVVEPVAANDIVDQGAVLSFYSTARFYRELQGLPGRLETRPVRVLYYLKARKSANNNALLPGAYLMRRIEPFTFDTSDPDPVNWKILWDTPIEDDICTFVRGVKVYYHDRNRPTQPDDARFIEALDTAVPASDPILWEVNPRAVVFKINPDWSNQLDQPFTKKDFLPPALMIELFLCDTKGQTFLEERRVYNLPIAPVRIPAKPGMQ